MAKERGNRETDEFGTQGQPQPVNPITSPSMEGPYGGMGTSTPPLRGEIPNNNFGYIPSDD